jgi:hypothetical protein
LARFALLALVGCAALPLLEPGDLVGGDTTAMSEIGGFVVDPEAWWCGWEDGCDTCVNRPAEIQELGVWSR